MHEALWWVQALNLKTRFEESLDRTYHEFMTKVAMGRSLQVFSPFTIRAYRPLQGYFAHENPRPPRTLQ